MPLFTRSAAPWQAQRDTAAGRRINFENQLQREVLTFVRENPIPFWGLFGLVAGAAIRFGLARPALADSVWLVVFVVGGAPTVIKSLRKMLKGNFAADLVALLAIITAVIMQA